MVSSLASAVLVLFGIYIALSLAVLLLLFIRASPDFLSDAIDALVALGARVVRPSASEADVERWSEMAFAWTLILLLTGSTIVVLKAILAVFG